MSQLAWRFSRGTATENAQIRVPAELWVPAFEDVIQSAFPKTVVNLCPMTIVIYGIEQPWMWVNYGIPWSFPTEFEKITDFSQPSAKEANWITSSFAGMAQMARVEIAALLVDSNWITAAFAGMTMTN